MTKGKIFLLRHASPDFSQANVQYSVLPGPPLSTKGEMEARQLSLFFKGTQIVKIYCSPFLRTLQTAQILSEALQIPIVEHAYLMEWQDNETEEAVKKRMMSLFDEVVNEMLDAEIIGLVTHGGPIRVLLQELGLGKEEMAKVRASFDNANPLPPAGAWGVEWDKKEKIWRLKLEFSPIDFSP